MLEPTFNRQPGHGQCHRDRTRRSRIRHGVPMWHPTNGIEPELQDRPNNAQLSYCAGISHRRGVIVFEREHPSASRCQRMDLKLTTYVDHGRFATNAASSSERTAAATAQPTTSRTFRALPLVRGNYEISGTLRWRRGEVRTATPRSR
jgi:hypothetical protein